MNRHTQNINDQRVNIGSSITQEFVVSTALNDTLVDSSVKFWRQKLGLVPVTLERTSDKTCTCESVRTARLVMEGGTFWSVNFEKYRKIVQVNMRGLRNHTYAQVRIDLPGAYRLSSKEIEQAVETINLFQTHLS